MGKGFIIRGEICRKTGKKPKNERESGKHRKRYSNLRPGHIGRSFVLRGHKACKTGKQRRYCPCRKTDGNIIGEQMMNKRKDKKIDSIIESLFLC